VRRTLLFGMVVALVTGCGSSSSASPTATPSPSKTYNDPTFHYSFKYPGAWSISPKGGHATTLRGVKTYVVDVQIPGKAAGLQITTDAQIIPFPPFVDGKISPDPTGGPDTFHYYHAKISGLAAMHVERWNGKQMTEVDTFVNTQTRAYDVRMNTATPPFSSKALAGYNAIVKSMRLPFS
jgi:hypothetical protein